MRTNLTNLTSLVKLVRMSAAVGSNLINKNGSGEDSGFLDAVLQYGGRDGEGNEL